MGLGGFGTDRWLMTHVRHALFGCHNVVASFFHFGCQNRGGSKAGPRFSRARDHSEASVTIHLEVTFSFSLVLLGYQLRFCGQSHPPDGFMFVVWRSPSHATRDRQFICLDSN